MVILTETFEGVPADSFSQITFFTRHSSSFFSCLCLLVPLRVRDATDFPVFWEVVTTKRMTGFDPAVCWWRFSQHHRKFNLMPQLFGSTPKSQFSNTYMYATTNRMVSTVTTKTVTEDSEAQNRGSFASLEKCQSERKKFLTCV